MPAIILSKDALKDIEKSKGASTTKASIHTKEVFPASNTTKAEAVSELPRNKLPEGTKNAYRTLRDARSEARLVGVREKRRKAKEEEAAATKK